MQLHVSRTSGYSGAEAIQAVNVAAWFDIHGVEDNDSRIRYYDFLTSMDGVFLNWQRVKMTESRDDHESAK